MRDRGSGYPLRLPGRDGREGRTLLVRHESRRDDLRFARDRDRRACLFRNWAPPISATGLRSSSDSRSSPPRPGLVPLTFATHELAELSGVALPVRARAGGAAFAEAMLDHSSRAERAGDSAGFFVLESRRRDHARSAAGRFPATTGCAHERPQRAATARSVIGRQRFAAAWCARHASPKPLAQLARTRARSARAELVHDWPILPDDTEGYPKAEVTVGGVETSELSSKTMEARKVPGLYFIGEVVDVTGWLGGYNFQWAWASGHAAGEVA